MSSQASTHAAHRGLFQAPPSHPSSAACWPQRVAHPGSPTLRRGESQQIVFLAWLAQSF